MKIWIAFGILIIASRIISALKKSGFDIEQKLKKIKGPFIEIAGPTHSYKLVDIRELRKKLYISNISFSFLRIERKLDFWADGRNLPVKYGSVGALFISHLGKSPETDPEISRLRKRLRKERSLQEYRKMLEKYTKLVDKQERQKRNNILQEAYMALENGGVLIWEGGVKEDVEFAKKLGFIIRKLIGCPAIKDCYKCIFEK